jgi:hypothetical protein
MASRANPCTRDQSATEGASTGSNGISATRSTPATAGGFIGQSHRPTGRRDRGAQPNLVRAQHGTGRHDAQRWVRHPVHRYLAATLDGFVNDLDAVFEAKFMLPWSFSEEAAAEKHMAQLQHNIWVTNARSAVLSIITGGGKWIEMTVPADALYQHFLVTAERRFWRCVQTGDTPRPYGVEPPRPRIEAVRIVDMSDSNSWAEFARLFCATRPAFLDHERAKSELKALMPEDAKEASGHGVRAKRSKSGAISFDLVANKEANHAAI